MNINNISNWLLPFVGTISVIIVTILYSFSKLREMNATQANELIKTTTRIGNTIFFTVLAVGCWLL